MSHFFKHFQNFGLFALDKTKEIPFGQIWPQNRNYYRSTQNGAKQAPTFTAYSGRQNDKVEKLENFKNLQNGKSDNFGTTEGRAVLTTYLKSSQAE